MTTNVLVTTVDPEVQGGVATFWKAVRPFMGPSVEYLVVGRRTGQCGVAATATRLVADRRRLRAALDSRRFDLVHVNPSLGPKALLRDGLNLLSVRRRGLPALVFIHGWDQETEARLRGPGLALFRRTFLRADAIIVLAREFERKLRGLGYRGPIHVTTTAVPDDAFAAAPRRAAAQDAVRLLYLSRFEPRKGVLETIQAFALLKKSHPGLALTLAGAGLELPAVSALIGDLGLRDVTLTGHVSGAAKARAFSEADIFLFPSSYGEGMPTVVLEAMAGGLPVVTRPVGGLADFFESGRMGFATDSVDPHAIAPLIERLIADPHARQTMGDYNRQYARRRFHGSVVAGRLLSIYAETVALADSGGAPS